MSVRSSAVGTAPCDQPTPTFFHRDALGTVDTVTSSGDVTGRQKRDPFGRIYAPGTFTDPTPTVALGFIGQAEDREERLIDLNRRLYDANLGRFISPDPLVKNMFDGQAYNRFA